MSTATKTIDPQKTPAGLVGLLDKYIADESLQPGDRLPSIRDLAAQLGLKSGAVRDALLEAQGRGIVKVLPRSGTYVAQAAGDLSNDSAQDERLRTRLQKLLPSQGQNLFHLLDVREMLEREAITLAASKRELQDLFPLRQILEEMASMPSNERDERYTQLDIEFHLEIARLSGNTVLVAMLCTLLEELTPYLLDISWSAERHAQTDASHARLYSVLVDGDAQVARNEIRTHLQVAYNTLLEEIREPPGGACQGRR
ncbi:FCD domain-containing protein [Pirellulales bacterium]|nr:FCD domain-containing protein [Pirellulales bacterium]